MTASLPYPAMVGGGILGAGLVARSVAKSRTDDMLHQGSLVPRLSWPGVLSPSWFLSPFTAYFRRKPFLVMSHSDSFIMTALRCSHSYIVMTRGRALNAFQEWVFEKAPGGFYIRTVRTGCGSYLTAQGRSIVLTGKKEMYKQTWVMLTKTDANNKTIYSIRLATKNGPALYLAGSSDSGNDRLQKVYLSTTPYYWALFPYEEVDEGNVRSDVAYGNEETTRWFVNQARHFMNDRSYQLKTVQQMVGSLRNDDQRRSMDSALRELREEVRVLRRSADELKHSRQPEIQLKNLQDRDRAVQAQLSDLHKRLQNAESLRANLNRQAARQAANANRQNQTSAALKNDLAGLRSNAAILRSNANQRNLNLRGRQQKARVNFDVHVKDSARQRRESNARVFELESQFQAFKTQIGTMEARLDQAQERVSAMHGSMREVLEARLQQTERDLVSQKEKIESMEALSRQTRDEDRKVMSAALKEALKKEMGQLRDDFKAELEQVKAALREEQDEHRRAMNRNSSRARNLATELRARIDAMRQDMVKIRDDMSEDLAKKTAVLQRAVDRLKTMAALNAEGRETNKEEKATVQLQIRALTEAIAEETADRKALQSLYTRLPKVERAISELKNSSAESSAIPAIREEVLDLKAKIDDLSAVRQYENSQARRLEPRIASLTRDLRALEGVQHTQKEYFVPEITGLRQNMNALMELLMNGKNASGNKNKAENTPGNSPENTPRPSSSIPRTQIFGTPAMRYQSPRASPRKNRPGNRPAWKH